MSFKQIQAAFATQFPEHHLVDVFAEYVVAKSNDKYYEIGYRGDEEEIAFAEQEAWASVQLQVVQEMLTGSFQDTMIISEFKGRYPEVKVFEDVNLAELVGDDPNPVFVTLPIGMEDTKSGNGRFYDGKFLLEMERQVTTRKPIGLMGHLSSEEVKTAFPPEAVHWVGVQRQGKLLWGKGYVPPGEARNRLQRYKATGKKIATSIAAKADGIWDATISAYRMVAESLQLNQIDIAPEDRAGIASLAAVPILTREMLESNGSNQEPVVQSTEDQMEKDEVIKGLTAEDVAALPDAVKGAILAEQMVQLRQELGLPETIDVTEMVRSLQAKQKEQTEQAVSMKITELIEDPDKGIKVEAVRELVTDLVMAKAPASVEEAEQIYEMVSQSPSVQKALAINVQETMGPSQRSTLTPPAGTQTTERKGKYFVIPEVGE